jgi:ribonuclease HI
MNLYSDGACEGNPGKGAYAAILQKDNVEKTYTKAYKHTTNNRMELLGVIEPLEEIKESSQVDIYSDSQYVVNAINKQWLENWIKNNWKKSNKKKVLNIDLWKRMVVMIEKHQLAFHWIRGHDEHIENEKCDKLAVSARQNETLNEDLGYVNG